MLRGYIYDQTVTGFTLDSVLNDFMRNSPVYSLPLKVVKGVDNPIKIQLLNADQKTYNLIGKALIFNMIDGIGGQIILQYNLQLDPYAGIGSLLIPANDLLNIDAGHYNYSIYLLDSNNNTRPVYIDTDYNSQGNIQILDTIYPEFFPSITPNIGPVENNQCAYSSAVVTSDLPNPSGDIHTLQFYTNNFTGNLIIRAAADPVPPINVSNSWCNVATLSFTNNTFVGYYNFTGVYPLLQFMIQNSIDPNTGIYTTGNVSALAYRN